MRLSRVIAHLKANCPELGRRVGGAAEQERAHENGYAHVPAAYVVPLADDPGENVAANGLWQAVTESIGVVLVLDNTPDRRGQAGVLAVEDMKAAVHRALLNWRPDPDRAALGLRFEGGNLIAADGARLFYQLAYSHERVLTDADGWQPDAVDLDGVDVARIAPEGEPPTETDLLDVAFDASAPTGGLVETVLEGLPSATAAARGLMEPADKAKLDLVAPMATRVTAPADIGAAPAAHGHDLPSLGGTLPLGKGGTGAADAAGARAALGLGGMATQAANNVSITGGGVDGVDIGLTNRPALAVLAKLRNTFDGAADQRAIGASSAETHATAGFRQHTRWYGGPLVTADGAAQDIIAPNKVIFTDACSIQAPGEGPLVGAFGVSYNISGTPSTGTQTSRHALVTKMAVNSKVGDAGYTATVVNQANGYSAANQGGTGGSSDPGDYRGEMFGNNTNVWLADNATNYRNLIGQEINVGLFGTGSSYSRIGLFVVEKQSARRAVADDAAIAMTGGGGGFNGFKVGLQFGATWGSQPVAATGTLIGVQPRQFPAAATPGYAKGLDLSAATFSDSSIKVPGLTVDGAGNIESAGLLARNFASDAAAAAGGVPVGGMYHNAGAVRVRLA